MYHHRETIKMSEYDQKIPPPQTVDKLVGHATITRHQRDKQSKATSYLFPTKMIAKLEWTQRSAQQNISHHGSIIQQRINNSKTTA